MSSIGITPFNRVYLSSLDASRHAADALVLYWSEIGINRDVQGQLELCVVEMVNNAFLHAYQGIEGRPITVQCKMLESESASILTLVIEDEGQAMTQRQLIQAITSDFVEPDPEDESTWTTSGRGFIIVSNLMDEVTMDIEPEKNRFLMQKKLKPEEINNTTVSQ